MEGGAREDEKGDDEMITSAQEKMILKRIEQYLSTGYDGDYKTWQVIRAIVEDEKVRP